MADDNLPVDSGPVVDDSAPLNLDDAAAGLTSILKDDPVTDPAPENEDKEQAAPKPEDDDPLGMAAKFSQLEADNAALRLKVQELTAKYDDVMSRWYEMRGVETPCAKCGGAGWLNYASTATWHGGIGGQVITAAVCDTCWGSGDVNRKGEDLRKLHAHLTTLETLVKEYGDARLKFREEPVRAYQRLMKAGDALLKYHQGMEG